ncbi:hypothetical protein [Verminephrobacter aporrectodeae]|uniref:hypothetical protein n=1 Tax=Verminephrobacter aporrectodeae TaxID=1110389 RepID=UPI0022433CA3|nr:hypothetical protein [Verminephrobacter aporrectodeae]MCW8174278.1 hypothetical protein [Verminephrobacter aporrectodeae subsp. tuberculatae]MCW8201977.1 hypothetical protein [Verminephrobacter aporrectodeae subsp. tuberculatae]
MSMRLVLSHYLESLRERNELDALLPELLVAMGHSVHSRPQIGVAQGGVDVLSSFPARGADKEAFLFIIKFGSVGREDLYTGKQAIEPSVREACTEYVRTRLPQTLRNGKKRLVLLTNGVVKQEAQSGFASLTAEVAEKPGCTLELWGSDQLAPLIEAHLFDESLLLKAGKDQLRRAIATLDDSDASIRRFMQFVDSAMTDTESSQAGKLAARKRRFLKRCATAVVGWSVFASWAKTESNLKPSVDGGEYLVLRLWAEAIKHEFIEDKTFRERFDVVKILLRNALHRYFEKVEPQLLDPRMMLSYRDEWVLYNRLLLEELGRIGLFLLLTPKTDENSVLRTKIQQLLVKLLNAHPGCRLPAMDGQSIDLSLVLTALMSEEDWTGVSNWVTNIANRMYIAVKSKRYIPVDTDLLEDAIAAHASSDDVGPFFRTSSLVPMLATVASMADDEKALAVLRNELHPLIRNVTLERWFPKAELEVLAADKQSVQSLGISRALSELKPSCAEEASASIHLPQGAASANEFRCMQLGHEALIAISARLFRHPLPTWYIERFRRVSR